VESRTGRNLLIRVYALEELGGIVKHVGPLGQLVLGDLDILIRENVELAEVCEEGEGEVAVQVWDDCFAEIVFCHDCWLLGRGERVLWWRGR